MSLQEEGDGKPLVSIISLIFFRQRYKFIGFTPQIITLTLKIAYICIPIKLPTLFLRTQTERA